MTRAPISWPFCARSDDPRDQIAVHVPIGPPDMKVALLIEHEKLGSDDHQSPAPPKDRAPAASYESGRVRARLREQLLVVRSRHAPDRDSGARICERRHEHGLPRITQSSGGPVAFWDYSCSSRRNHYVEPRCSCGRQTALPRRHFEHQAIFALIVQCEHDVLGRESPRVLTEVGGQVAVDQRDDRL